MREWKDSIKVNLKDIGVSVCTGFRRFSIRFGEHDNEPSSAIIGAELFEKPRDSQVSKNNSIPMRYVVVFIKHIMYGGMIRRSTGTFIKARNI
jgi:hypothetical protein